MSPVFFLILEITGVKFGLYRDEGVLPIFISRYVMWFLATEKIEEVAHEEVL